MARAIRMHQHGGPDVLRWEEVDVARPTGAQALVRQSAVGLNFIDVYHRTGLYPVQLPSGIGLEAAGVVEALGPDVRDLKVGDRVAYAGGPLGAYADRRLVPAGQLVVMPEGVDDRTAAAMMLKGMTAEYLLRRTVTVKHGDAILVHAAAGGVGLILCQWASTLGATVIGTVSTSAKAELAKSHGCHHPLITTEGDWVARSREITGGKGVRVVYDSVGKDTFLRSLDCLAPRGMMALFGQSSGPVDPVNPGLLAAKGSLFLTRPSLMAYNATRAELADSAAALFEVVAAGKVRIEINQTYPLAEAARAHRDLEARKTTGSTVLLP
ncbi:MAG: quinone oxidoreductase [Alphaproteobacteria bacterium]|nr:quinone oxidoreductase [Alphaproteobacteria bacterium]